MKGSLDYYLQPFYLGEWVPRHVKNSSPLRMAELSKILIGRYEVLETRLHTIYGGRKENFHKTSVPFVGKRK